MPNIILAVDKEPANLKTLTEILQKDYQLHCVDNGAACLKLAPELKPDVILLDASMQTDAYQVCQQLKNNPETEDIAVMFSSSRVTAEDRIASYNAGAIDYLVKPFASKELQTKLSGWFGVIENRQLMQSQLDDATATAFNAMSLSSEMGIIVQYIESIGGIQDIKELAQALMLCLQSFSLKSCVAVKVEQQMHYFSSEGNCSTMTIELFELLKDKGRLYEFAPRILVNYPLVNLLILNMPVEDEEKLGRFRDHVCFLVSVTEKQLESILTTRKLLFKEQQLKQAFSLVRSKFEDLVSVLNTSHEMNELIFRELQSEFEGHIPYMGLDEDQEQYIFNKLDDTIQKSVAREDLLTDVKQVFYDVEQDLAKMLT